MNFFFLPCQMWQKKFYLIFFRAFRIFCPLWTTHKWRLKTILHSFTKSRCRKKVVCRIVGVLPDVESRERNFSERARKCRENNMKSSMMWKVSFYFTQKINFVFNWGTFVLLIRSRDDKMKWVDVCGRVGRMRAEVFSIHFRIAILTIMANNRL